ncbi:VOC family protein [Actinoplanes sp. NPDC024001]|uniref:VOC family protein n=1 Tax=Actinoplanes sp. NPDC024001 TaxID=3154598 RepID=UPI0034074266
MSREVEDLHRRLLRARDAIGRGYARPLDVALHGLVLNTDDVRGLHEDLRARGFTDFTQEPTEHFYGTDMTLRDPSGNEVRILQQGKS